MSHENIITIEEIKTSIKNHSAFTELLLFGQLLKKIPLTQQQIKIFFATMWSFFSETPSGILSLALRVHDYVSQLDPWNAMAKSAYILSTAVDEFGLERQHENFSPTHHQLFRITTSHFNITSEDLLDKKNILPGGSDIRAISFQFYRNENILKSLGFHLASELTSWYEFSCFLNGFLAQKDHYKIQSEKDPAMKFFLIHTILEPSHLLTSEKIADFFIDYDVNFISLISQGADTYMNYYYHLFKQLNQTLFQGQK